MHGGRTLTKSTESIKSLQRAFSIIEILSEHPHGIGLTEIAAIMELPKSTVHRFLSSISWLGYICKDAMNKYHLTLRLYEIGSRSVKTMDIMETARPLLDRIAEDIGLTVHFATLSDDHVLYLYKASFSVLPINTSSFIGSSAPVYCTGIGKAVMAYLPEDKAYAIWNQQDIVQYTANTITAWQDFRTELAHIRAVGYATDNEEHELGVCCIALPVFNYRGFPKYAMSLTFSKTRMNAEFIEDKLSILRSAAHRLSVFCGADPGILV